MTDNNNDDYQPVGTGQRPAELAFAIFVTVIAAILLSQLGEQTKFVKKLTIFKQPGFWPGLSLAGMLVCGLFYSVNEWRKKEDAFVRGRNLTEILFWLRGFEYLAWFMVYVWMVPLIGYLPGSVIFAVALCWRAGFRTGRWYGLSALLATGIVVLFKGFLSVKIPGGAIYEYAPDSIRTFLLVWL